MTYARVRLNELTEERGYEYYISQRDSQALKDKGFNPGAIDGVFGARRPCLKSPLIQLGHSQYRPR